MKNIIIILATSVALLSFATAHAQLVADAGNDTTVCVGSAAQLNAVASGGTPPYTFTWVPATGLSCVQCNNPVCAPSVTTTYYVEATDSLGATATDSVIITVNPVPVIDSHNTIDVSCFGGMDGSSCPVVSGGVQPYVYAWGTVHTTQCLTNLAYGNYHYTVADVN